MITGLGTFKGNVSVLVAFNRADIEAITSEPGEYRNIHLKEHGLDLVVVVTFNETEADTINAVRKNCPNVEVPAVFEPEGPKP